MTTQIEATVTIHRYPNGNIDWEKTIRAYASDSDMSFREAMGWLSKRDTLEQVAQLLGLEVDLWNGNPKNKGIVNTLGAFLESKGYTVPRLQVFGHDDYIKSRPRQHPQLETTIDMDAVKARLDAERKRNAAKDVKEAETLSFTLTRDEYLAKRLSGMGRTDIAREQGLKNSGGLYYYLRQWGLKDRVVEERELEKLNNQPYQSQEPTVAPVSDVAATVSQQPQEPAPSVKPITKEVTFTVTLTESIIRASLQALVDEAHTIAVDHGWHEDNVALPVQLALIHSEVSEALDADRKGHGSDKVAEELADVVIRVFDTAAAQGLDLVGATFAKMEKNRNREHRHGGRKY